MKIHKNKLVYPKNPWIYAGFISKLTFWWTKDIFRIGLLRSITVEDFYELTPNLKSSQHVQNVVHLWDLEVQNCSPNILRPLWKLFGLRIVLLGMIAAVFQTLTRGLQPFFLASLVEYFSVNQVYISESKAFLYASGIVICGLTNAVIWHSLNYSFMKIGNKIKLGLCGLIFHKCLKSPQSDGISSRAINLMSSDLKNYDTSIATIHNLWMRPMEVFIYGYIMYQEIGAASIVGISFLLLFIPLQAWCGKRTSQEYTATSKITDLRLKIINEMIQGIEAIKMYVWETSFIKLVSKIRFKEMSGFISASNTKTILSATHLVSSISIFLCIITYISWGGSLSARKVFFISCFFNILNEGMIKEWPQSLMTYIQLNVSCKRVTEFLLEGVSTLENKRYKKSKGNSLIFENVSARWETNIESIQNHLKNITLKVEHKSLVGVIGQVGSGKTTLLNSILGETFITEGRLKVGGKLSYANQDPWLFQGTVKDNIVFVEEYDPVRYAEVVKACALLPDFKRFPDGDETVIGERGVTLSGGQKARISLARAVYREADIYLLDDPLSSVDVEVRNYIFEKCIKEFLKSKTRILVTHQTRFLKDVDQVVVLKNGVVENQVNFENTFLKNFEKEIVHEEDFSKDKVSLNENHSKKKKALKDENSGFESYSFYFGALGNYYFIAAVFVLVLLNKLTMTKVDSHLSKWVNWEQNIISNGTAAQEENLEIRKQLIFQYSIFLILALVVFIAKTVGLSRMCLKIAYNIHEILLNRICRAKMYFFNSTPSGNIMSTFSRDFRILDCCLPETYNHVLTLIVDFLVLLLVISSANPYLLFPATSIMTILLVMRQIYSKSSQILKKLEIGTRSPLNSLTNEAFQGLTTVRAFEAESFLQRVFQEYLDDNSRAWFMIVSTSRAFCFWIDLVCVFYVFIVTFSFLIFKDNYQSGDVGLAILQCLSIIGSTQYNVRQTVTLQNQMGNVDKVREFCLVPVEETRDCGRLITDWPKEPRIKFINFSLKYSEDGKSILKNLNFEINPKEKIGIVGRTGAGKSSITQALLRLAINEGIIEIDDVDISQISLKDLRSRISIIPQDPVLFSGTLRYNLDPFDIYDNKDLWKALQKVKLFDYISNLPLKLLFEVKNGGSNFSMGQRQLICLARVLLSKNKILILDEATANVDSETGKLIQSTIKKEFQNCTVLTIAHRLNTILDYDKIIVMNDGDILEFGKPSELYQRNRIFQQLVNQSVNVSDLDKFKKI